MLMVLLPIHHAKFCGAWISHARVAKNVGFLFVSLFVRPGQIPEEQ